MKLWPRIVLVILTTFLLISCGSNQVTGNGKSVTKVRELRGFDQVKISGAYKVTIAQGSTESVKITTDSNIVPLVITDVKDDQLNIHNKPGVSFSLTQPVLVEIVVTNLKEITASGANELIVLNLNSEALQVNTSGSVQASLSGRVDKLTMEIAGSGNVDATHLAAKNVKVRMMGSGDIQVNAANKLDTKITGSGTVKYSGNPGDVDQSIIGSGTLERIK